MEIGQVRDQLRTEHRGLLDSGEVLISKSLRNCDI